MVRVEIAEDSVLLRDGVARLLEDADFDLVARARDADYPLRRVPAHKPDGFHPLSGEEGERTHERPRSR